jgi:hypothetical protein
MFEADIDRHCVSALRGNSFRGIVCDCRFLHAIWGSSVKTRLIWAVLALLLLTIFVLTFVKPPEAITARLMQVSTDLQGYSAVAHLLFLAVVAIGVLVARAGDSLFPSFIAYLSLSATVIAVKYGIVPNIILFALYFVLIVHAYSTKKLNFRLHSIPRIDLLFGMPALVFGFWYLHWVQSPVWSNALLYSPLGAVNCPTMVTVCGFLCLTQPPRSALLEAAVSLTTLYFGFFGLFRLGAYVDVALIICALYLLVRLSATLGAIFEQAQMKSRVP